MIDADNIAFMREAVAETLTGTCTITTRSQSVGDTGRVAYSLTATAGVACRVGKLSPKDETLYADRISGKEAVRITLPAGTTVGVDDVVTTGGRAFEVYAVDGSVVSNLVCLVVFGVAQ